MKLLLISNSTMRGEKYLEWPKKYIKAFIDKHNIKSALFIPYAGVALKKIDLQQSYDAYIERVANVYKEFGVKVVSIHQEKDPEAAVKKAKSIIVGGGNTFHLVYELHKNKVMTSMREAVLNGVPFMGWSAGSNVACPTLRTTNDMPIIEPASFKCLNLVPFQINPHYLPVENDMNYQTHGGETRDERLIEFITINKKVRVVGLREACLLEIDGATMELKGQYPMRIYQWDKELQNVVLCDIPASDVSYLLK
ncbi:MAG: dipeptidase PepE [Bacteroidales bacterium]|nr:dipeptidase PepE [Bacteroidales bacterium]